MSRNMESFAGFSVGQVVDGHLEPAPHRDRSFRDPRLANPFEDFEEAYPMAPCRSIEITPEIRAKDEADRRARERDNITWRRPEPLPPTSYRLPAGRSHGQRRSTKTRNPESKPKLSPTHNATSSATRRNAMAGELSEVECAGGCGIYLTQASVDNGIKYAYGHKNGCPGSERASRVTRPQKTKAAPRPKLSIEQRIAAMAQEEYETADAGLVLMIGRRDQLTKDIEAEASRVQKLRRVAEMVKTMLNPKEPEGQAAA